MQRDGVSHMGHLTAYMKQWPSLRQDQGITLNPLDRCHMHARAHKYTEKPKKKKKNGGERGGENERVKKRGKGDGDLRERAFTRAKAQRTACIVTPALVC